MSEVKSWIHKKERGSPWTIHLMYGLCRHRLQWVVYLLLHPIVMYFFLTSGDERKASRQFFLRAQGHYSWRDYYKQLMFFARSLVDRVLILMGQSGGITLHSHGRDQLVEAQRRGEGGIMLGAHLGSPEACKGMHEDEDVDVFIVAYHAVAQKIQSLYEEINPDILERIIDPSAPEAIFKMRDVVENGGMLVILADRVGIGEKSVQVDFLGEKAWVPAGAYHLAAILKCPIYSFFAVSPAHRVYEKHFIKLADQVDIPRSRREERVTEYAQQYADVLAQFARKYPHNWFNFFDFWHKEDKRA